MRRHSLPLAGVLLLLPGCADTLGTMGTVTVGDNSFEAGSVQNGETTANVGDTWTFVNQGGDTHTVTVHRPPDDATNYIKDVTLAPGQETTLSFDQGGTYHVFCRFHGDISSGMHLDVAVPA